MSDTVEESPAIIEAGVSTKQELKEVISELKQILKQALEVLKQ